MRPCQRNQHAVEDKSLNRILRHFILQKKKTPYNVWHAGPLFLFHMQPVISKTQGSPKFGQQDNALPLKKETNCIGVLPKVSLQSIYKLYKDCFTWRLFSTWFSHIFRISSSLPPIFLFSLSKSCRSSRLAMLKWQIHANSSGSCCPSTKFTRPKRTP